MTSAHRVTPPLAAAIEYATLAFRVVALHTPMATGPRPRCSCRASVNCARVGKHPRYHPRTLAHGALSATTDPDIIRGWWRDWPDANVGLATGRRSNILVLDIDPRNGGTATLRSLESERGPLPHTVEAVTGGGGRHLLFRHPPGDVVGRLGPGVDVLSDGSLIVVEPSVHPSGRSHAWVRSAGPGDAELAELPGPWLLVLVARVTANGAEAHPPHPTSVIPVDPALPVPPCPSWEHCSLLHNTVPDGPGQHDRRTMDFARAVKFGLGIKDAESARGLFDRWFELARPHIQDRDYDEGWFKFLRAFRMARIPPGAGNLLRYAWESARTAPPPACAGLVRSDRMRSLIGLCRELRVRTAGPFKLSCHQLAALYGVKPSRAWEWLRGLEEIGVIRCLDRGRAGQPGRGAATFEYLGEEPTTGGATSPP